MMQMHNHAPHPDPLGPYTLDALLEGAAHLQPQARALRDSTGASLTFAQVAQQVQALAAHFRLCGLEPGQTVLLTGGAHSAIVTALLAGIRAGLDVALAPPNIRADQLAVLALRLQAAAIIGGAPYGGFSPLDTALAAAALADSIRLVGSLAGGDTDGAVDFSAGTLGLQPGIVPADAPAHPARIITLLQDGKAFHPVAHQQRTLVAGALDLVARARLSASTPLLSTIAPLTYAGLAAGPLAMLVCGAALDLHGPFDSARLLAQVAAQPQVQFVVPAALLAAIERSGMLGPDRLGGLVILSRWNKDAADFSPPQAVTSSVPVVDLHAFAENALVAEPRGADGRARAILDPPHSINIGGILMLATGASNDANDALGFFGAAVTKDDDA